MNIIKSHINGRDIHSVSIYGAHKIIEYESSKGEIQNHKIDDMKRQSESEKKPYGIALVTDSTADVSKEIIDKYQIHVVSLSLFIDGIEYFDKLSIGSEKFYDMADQVETFPTNSVPPVSKFDEVFAILSSRYDSVIGFFMSSKISGTYKNAQKAADKIKSTGYRIDIIDSKLNSGAQGLVLAKIAEMIYIGKTHDDIIDQAQDMIKRTRIFVSVVDFDYMVRGGKVSSLNRVLARVFNLKPIVSLDKDGNRIAFGNAFSVDSAERKILKLLNEIHFKDKILSYNIVYSLNKDRANTMADKVEEIVGLKPLYISEISSVAGILTGRGAVAVSIMTER